MDKDLIEDFRKYIKPFVAKKLEEINYEEKGLLDNYEFQRDFDKILDLAIIGLTVDERPQGEWIKQGIYFGCPFCHCGCNSIIIDRIVFGRLNYCPNCGADMRGEEE